MSVDFRLASVFVVVVLSFLKERQDMFPNKTNFIFKCLCSLFTIGVMLANHQTCEAAEKAPQNQKWQSLFDGKTLEGWKSTQFGGEGEVHVKDGQIVLEMGSSLTGITYKGEVPKTNYEISLEAMQVEGIDFFCCLTFPVADSHCSFVVAGWSGSVVGLSSIDGRDASENETTQSLDFKNGKWYKVRVRVTPEKIEAWIDDKNMVDVDIEDKKITTRPEVDLSKPIGIASWETKAALRKIQIRKLTK